MTDDTQSRDSTAPLPEAAAGTQQNAAAAIQDVSLAILNQYVRDLSFENPNAPGILTNRKQPEFSISVNMGLRHLQERVYELILKVGAQSRVEKQAGFLIEVEYAGVFAVGKKVADPDIEPLIYIEGGKFLFPFARHILAEVSRMGGFPPVLLQMIDFGQLYKQHFEKNNRSAQNSSAQA